MPQFRLLNHLVGWDTAVVEGLHGFREATGVQLEALRDADVLVDESSLSKWLSPSRLATSCTGCDWYLVTPSPPPSRLLVRDACNPCWSEPLPAARGALEAARAIAVSPNLIAITDPGSNSILFFTDSGERQVGAIPFDRPGAIAYASWREWLVVDEQGAVLQRLDLAGTPLGQLPVPLPNAGPVDRLAVDDECRVWIAISAGDDRYTIWQAHPSDTEFRQARLSELQKAFRPTKLALVSEDGFCFQDSGDQQLSMRDCGICFTWYGRPWDTPAATPDTSQYVTEGRLLTLAIDSGIPRCRWHRVRMDADIPAGTTVSVAVASNEQSLPPLQDAEWAGHPVGTPHWADWQEAEVNSTDFLVQQPPGRYLFVRLRMSGDGMHTPRVRRIRLDFPRHTSLDQLPFVYRENPEAEDFSERFLSLFDAFLENVDEVVERLPSLFDTSTVPDELLPWLGRFLDVAMDPAWDADRRRRILQAAPKLFRMRGTVDGIRAAIHLVFDVDPVVQESPLERPWGAVGGIRLNSGSRLFGQSNWRFRLDRSRLSQAPLRSFGNPDRDPLNSLAYHFRVLVPILLDAQARLRLEQLVEAQKPAHTVVSVRSSDTSFILGNQIHLGIDTAFQSLSPLVLDEGGVRLGRSLVLSPARFSSRSGISPGRGAVGVSSVLG